MNSKTYFIIAILLSMPIACSAMLADDDLGFPEDYIDEDSGTVSTGSMSSSPEEEDWSASEDSQEQSIMMQVFKKVDAAPGGSPGQKTLPVPLKKNLLEKSSA
jgi:hypothetical protein